MSFFIHCIVLIFLLIFSPALFQEDLNTNNILTLKQAIETALINNHHVRSALSSLPITEANLIIAKYRPNPVLGANSEIVKGGSIHPIQAGAPLEIGKKRHWRIQLAKEQISKKELEIAKVLWETRAQVHASYASLSVGLELYNLAKKRTEFYNSLLDIAEKRFQAGDISELELNRTKIELVRSQNLLSEFEGKLKRAQIDFNHDLGKNPEEELVLQMPEELKPKIKVNNLSNLNEILADATNKRLETAILEKEFGINRAQLKKAMWERLPNLFIEGGPAKPSFHENVWGPYIGTQIEVPLFNRRQGEIKQAKAEAEFLEKEKERIEHDIKVEVTNAFEDLKIREEQVGRFEEKVLNEAENILDKIKAAYGQGKLTLTDVLNAEEQNRDIKGKYLESLFNYQFALASLEYAVGITLEGFSE